MSQPAKEGRYSIYRSRSEAVRAELWRGAKFGGKWMALIIISIDLILWVAIGAKLLYEIYRNGIVAWYSLAPGLPRLMLLTSGVAAAATIYSAIFGSIIMGAGAAIGFRRPDSAAMPDESRNVPNIQDKSIIDHRTQPAAGPGWSIAYFAVLALAIMLLPFSVFVAIVTTTSIAYVAKQMGIAMGGGTAFFVRLGLPGFITIGSVALLSIVGMFPWRRRAWVAISCIAVLVCCVIFCLVAALASHIPFWGITWRLSA